MAAVHTAICVECDQPVQARGWCTKHYARWRRTGRLDLKSDKERFWEKVDLFGSYASEPWLPLDSNCWLWLGAVTSGGYGIFSLGARSDGSGLSHRIAYEWLVGSIPDDKQLDHLCRVRNCVRPDHLEVVTSRVNTLRGNTTRQQMPVKRTALTGMVFRAKTYICGLIGYHVNVASVAPRPLRGRTNDDDRRGSKFG